MSEAVVARGLVKRYGDVTALDGLDLNVPQGKVLGLLGPNGAGKTTAVCILTTLLKPDAGDAWVAGIDVSVEPTVDRDAPISVKAFQTQLKAIEKWEPGLHHRHLPTRPPRNASRSRPHLRTAHQKATTQNRR